MKVVPSTYHWCFRFLHNGIKITIHIDPNPFAYCNVLEASYTNHLSRIKIGNTMASSSSTYHNPDTILASSLSIVKINYQSYGEYNLLDAFFVDAFPLNPYTRGRPIYQNPKLYIIP